MTPAFSQASALRSSLGQRSTSGITPTHTDAKRPPLTLDGKSALKSHAGAGEHEQLVKQTQNWVAQTFFGTLLKQMHDSPFKSEMFSGGRGGEAFTSLYDQHLAQKLAHGTGKKIVNALVRKIEAKKAKERAGNAVQSLAPSRDTNSHHQDSQSSNQSHDQPSSRWRANLSGAQVEQLSTGLDHVATAR